MAGKRAWEIEHGFFAFYNSKEHPENYGVRQIAEMLQKEYNASYSKSTISNMIAQVGELIATDPAIKQQYEEFNKGASQPKYFYRWTADGKIDSPYQAVRNAAERTLAKNGEYPDGFKAALQKAEKFWVFVNRKNPDNWTEQEWNRYGATISQGSKFATAVALRAFSKPLKDIDGMTDGLKGDARMPSVLKLPNFPEIFKQLQNKCIELADYEEKKDVEFIMRVKPAVGIRTGKRKTGKGLWGTKISPPEKNKRGHLLSHIQVVGDNLMWHAFEKGNEHWDITFMTDELRSYIIRFVKSKKMGDFLISTVTERRMNEILGQACEALGIEKLILHDMRKIGISFLVRAGVPLEKAITVNVGWKDIATAFKHYLALSNLGEKEPEYKAKLVVLYAGGASA